MKDLLSYIVGHLVENPGEARIETGERDGGELLKLTVAPDDMGRVIGRSGRTARAIRQLLRAAAGSEGSRVNLEIVEQE